MRELSEKFDNWSPDSFRLSQADIEAAMSAVSARDLEDIKFAQANVRGGPEALEDRPSAPSRVWNRIPASVRNQIIDPSARSGGARTV